MSNQPKALRVADRLKLWSDQEDLLETAAELRSLHEMNAELLTGMKSMVRAYVNLLESARDRIIFLGGSCDSVDVMESNDPVLRETRSIIDKAQTRA